MAELHFDEEATQRLISVYITPDVVEQREMFVRALDPQKGEHILDVGSGPGFVASSLAQITGPTGAVHGIDVSEPMIAIARKHCVNSPWAEFRRASATNLPFPDCSFDAAISTQVLEYVEDIDTALAELFRVIRPTGRILIVDTDWDSIVWHSSDRKRMERILSAWEEHATDPRLPRTLANRLTAAGFQIDSQAVAPLFNPSFDPNTYSNRIIDLIVDFVSGRFGMEPAEVENWANDLRSDGATGNYFFSLNRYVFAGSKPS